MPNRKTNIRLSEACERYVQRIDRAGQSETSVRTASYALDRLQRGLYKPDRPNPLLHTLTFQDIEDYCYGAGGIRNGVKAVSFNRQRSVLLRFFKYAEQMTWIDESPMNTIEAARLDQPTPKLLLSPVEMVELLAHASNPIERMALSVGMNTGLRANDLKRLTIFDVNLSNGTIQTEIRKTKKLDVKPITMDLERELQRWLITYAGYLELESTQLIPNDYLLLPVVSHWSMGGRVPYSISPKQMHTHPWRMVQRPLKRMGYETKQNGFHVLRRSSARALFEMLRQNEGGRDHSLMIVKDYLNHSSVTMTEHYLGLSHERTLRDGVLKGRSFLTQEVKEDGESDNTGVRHLRDVAS